MSLDDWANNKKPSSIDKIPSEIHVRGVDEWTYWDRFKIGWKLIFGARIHYHFCNSIMPSFLNKKEFNSFEHLKSFATIVIAHGEPRKEEASKLDPMTH